MHLIYWSVTINTTYTSNNFLIDLQVESTEGVGSTFFCTIRFELCKEEQPDRLSLKSQYSHRNKIGVLKTEEVQVGFKHRIT